MSGKAGSMSSGQIVLKNGFRSFDHAMKCVLITLDSRSWISATVLMTRLYETTPQVAEDGGFVNRHHAPCPGRPFT